MNLSIDLPFTIIACTAAFIAGIFFTAGSLDQAVIDGCVKNGYWQFRQERIICTLEVPVKKEK